MIEIGKNYTLRELIEMKDQSPEAQAFVNSLEAIKESKKYNKPKITKFEEFDDQTKNIYLTIASELKKLNLDQNFKLIATGSRVTGKWRKDDEADELAAKFNIKVKYSDYDFITDAINIPDLTALASELGVKKLNKIGSYNKNQEIEIPIN
jgi:hypothetical protein